MSSDSYPTSGDSTVGKGAAKAPLQQLCEGLLRLTEDENTEIVSSIFEGMIHAIGCGCDSTIQKLQIELGKIENVRGQLRSLFPAVSLGREGEQMLLRLDFHHKEIASIIESLRTIRDQSRGNNSSEAIQTIAASLTCSENSTDHVSSLSAAMPVDDLERTQSGLDESTSSVKSLVERAEAARREENCQLAEQLYTDVLKFDRNHEAALMQRGRLRLISGNAELAIEDFSAVIQNNSQAVAAFCARADAHALCKRLDAAISDYTQSLTLQPNFYLARYNRAVAYRLRGAIDVALEEFSHLLAIRPEYGPAHLNRGLVHELKGEWTQAACDFRNALRYQPTSREAMQHLQAVRVLLGSNDSAIRVPESPTPSLESSSGSTANAKDVSASKQSSPREKQDSLVVPCPRCKTETSIRWNKLQPGRVLTCPHCVANFTMRPSGELEEIVKGSTGRWMFRTTLHEQAREIQHRRLQIAGLVSVVLVLGILWWFPRTSQSSPGQSEIKLPEELEARAELFSRAWLSNDTRLMRRLTDPVHDRSLFTWSRRFPPPHLTQSPEKLKKDVKVELMRLPSQPPFAWIQTKFIGIEGRSLPLEMRFAWEERSGVWFFQPSFQ